MKLISLCAALALLTTLTACDKKKAPKAGADSTATKQAAARAQEGDIVYVDLDTLQAHYQYFLDGKERLEQQVKTHESEIARLGQQLQAGMNSLQERVQQGKITSQPQYEQEQQRLARQQQVLQQKQEAYARELQEKQDAFNESLHDSLNHFLSDYNRSKHFRLILSKVSDNILLSDPALDITGEVVAGLNKRYRK